MKLFEMEGFLRGKCIPRDLMVNETNAEYLVRKLAEAEARCAALAGENAGLKSKAAELVHEASEVYSAYNSTITEPDGDFMDMQTLQEMQSVKTPATDVFLAEVRAQGVEMLREHPAIKLCSLTHVCDEFAAQLRKGVQS